jgi:lipopolysaccharide assembly outer membrane protein LptD (OstA)
VKKSLIAFFILVSLFAFSKTIHIKADFVKPSDERIEYSGSVVLKIEEENFTLNADNLIVKKLSGKWRITEASSSVTVTLEDGELKGDTLIYDVETRVGTITGNVKGEFIDKTSTETIYMECEQITFDLEEDVFQGAGKVKIQKGSVVANSEEVVYKRKDGIIELLRSVRLKDKEKDLEMKAERVIMDLEEDTMEASSVTVTLEVE